MSAEALDLDALQALVDAASDGPWIVEEYTDYDGYAVYIDDVGVGTAYVCRDLDQGTSEGAADANFIATARAAVPALIAELRVARSRLQAVGQLADDLHAEAHAPQEARTGSEVVSGPSTWTARESVAARIRSALDTGAVVEVSA